MTDTAALPPGLIEQQLRDRSRRIIKTDGTIVPVDHPVRSHAEIEKLIGAQCTDGVNLRHLGGPLIVMIVDDNDYEVEVLTGDAAGAIEKAFADSLGVDISQVVERRPTKALKPVNSIATALYHANCVPGTTHQIVGDVYICHDEDFA